MTTPAQSFHLLVDPVGETASGRPEPIEVPPGVSYLSLAGGRPQLSAAALDDPSQVHVLEPVVQEHRLHLLLLSPAGRRTRLNGHVAPLAAVLQVKDQFQVDDEHVLHVTLYNRPRIGPPAEESLGQECPVCRFPFERQTTVYVCHNCGMPVHCEGDGGLDCVALGSECPGCHAPIVMKSGYTYYPEL
jgi:hypothetical protein